LLSVTESPSESVTLTDFVPPEAVASPFMPRIYVDTVSVTGSGAVPVVVSTCA
jgi:hypothetical protein